MTVAFSGRPVIPFYTGAATSDLVPAVFPVALNGRPYLIDRKSNEWGRKSIALLRYQTDTGNLPGEQSLSQEELWRRAQDSWSHGAGQSFVDRADSDPARFRRSKGVDVWSRWQLSLLPDTVSRRASSATNLMLETAGSYLYLTDGASLLFTQDVTVSPVWTAVTGLPAVAASAMTSDGFSVWTAHGTSGIYRSTRGAASSSSYVTGTVGLVGYVKGRLMAAQGGALFNVTASGALPAPLYTHPNTDFRWIGFAEGKNVLYAAGFSGDKSLIYRTAVKADGTALDVPQVAGELPDGETVRSIRGYLGYVVVGTDLGFRFAVADNNGDLTFGSLVNIGRAVYAFEPQDRFVWFGWPNYDTVSTGLGRMDLTVFTGGAANAYTPAYASDLMATGQGTVVSVVTFQNIRVFAVSGLGVYGQAATKVASGTLESGSITYGLPDAKVAMLVDVRTQPLNGSFSTAVSVDGGVFTDAGTASSVGSTSATFQLGQRQGTTFELRETLNRSSVDATVGPVVIRHTLRSYPAPPRGELIFLPLLLEERVTTDDGAEYTFDVRAEFDALRSMVQDHVLVTLQDGDERLSVFVEEFQWQPRAKVGKFGSAFYNGTMVLKMKSVAI